MTRKDFVLIADALRDAKPLPEDNQQQHGWRIAAHAVCNALASTNDRFDRERFLKACGADSNG